jgi:hypothetical protein
MLAKYKQLQTQNKDLFYHWKLGIVWLDNKSRVRWESQARFCEKLGLKCSCLLDFSFPFLSKLTIINTRKWNPMLKRSKLKDNVLLTLVFANQFSLNNFCYRNWTTYLPDLSFRRAL